MKKAAYILILFLLGGCAGKSIANKQLTTINSKTVEYVSIQQQPPTIVFINGGGAASMDSWAEVYPVIAKKHSTFAYNRFGVGKSSSDKAAQSVAYLSSTLHRLLKQESIKPPYILVGHSMGGLIGYDNSPHSIYSKQCT